MLGALLRRTSAQLKRDVVAEKYAAVAAFASRFLAVHLCGSMFTRLPSGMSVNLFNGAGAFQRPMLSRVRTRNLSK